MSQNIKELVWTEKFRPKNFNELILQGSEKKILINILFKPKQIPNFLFYSVFPGTGKTAAAHVIENETKCDIFKIKASKDRGIETVREINNFVCTKSFNPNIKRMVLLNEIHGLTKTAQDALNDLMEEYASNVFFVLTTNHINKVSKYIISRCMKINFSNPPKEQILESLDMIVSKENLDIQLPELKKLIDIKYPDIRTMVVLLQKCSMGGIFKNLLNEETIFDILIEAIKNEKFDKIKEIILSGEIVLQEFIDFIFFKLIQAGRSHSNISSACLSLCEIEKYLNENVDEKIIFFAYLDKIKEMS